MRHRLWVVPDDGTGRRQPHSSPSIAGARPVAIADGHHRYETALRYRDERRMTRSCEPDPAFDYLLPLFLRTDEPLTVLPTHRVVRGLGEAGVERLVGGLDRVVHGHAGGRRRGRERFEAAATLAGGGPGSGSSPATGHGSWRRIVPPFDRSSRPADRPSRRST